MVVMVVLPNPYILDIKWYVYFSVWKYRQGNHGIWRDENGICLFKRLLWISTQSIDSSCSCYGIIPHCFCLPVCILYWEVKFSEEVKLCLQRLDCPDSNHYTSFWCPDTCPTHELHVQFVSYVYIIWVKDLKKSTKCPLVEHMSSFFRSKYLILVGSRFSYEKEDCMGKTGNSKMWHRFMALQILKLFVQNCSHVNVMLRLGL